MAAAALAALTSSAARAQPPPPGDPAPAEPDDRAPLGTPPEPLVVTTVPGTRARPIEPADLPNGPGPPMPSGDPGDLEPLPPPPERLRATPGAGPRLPPAGFESPFVTSYLGIAWAGDFTALTYPRAVTPAVFRLKVASLSQAFDFGFRVHERASVFASLGGVVAGGVDNLSLYDFGIEPAFRYQVGLSAVVARSKRRGTQVTAHLVVSGATGGRVGAPAKLVQSLMETQQVPQGDAIFATRDDSSVRMAWSASQAWTSWLSMQAGVGFAGTTSGWKEAGVARADHATSTTFGVEATATLPPRIPVAVRIETDGNVLLRREVPLPPSPLTLLSDDNSVRTLFGLYYVGRPDLVLGVNGGPSVIAWPALGSRPAGLVRLDLRYVF